MHSCHVVTADLSGDVSPSCNEARLRVQRAVRAALLCAAIGMPALAMADDAPDAPDAEASLDLMPEVVVTGGRVVRDGFEAPTPISVVSSDELRSFASINVADALNTLPAIAGSWQPGTTQANASSGNSGINALNLRNMGTSRTLVLLNGQRVVSSSSSGLVDINTIPQELIERVEVVTGGASASWGSDAVGGVVNFILRKRYNGVKAELSGGSTSYGDNEQGRFSITAGTDIADGRGNVMFSGYYDRSNPIIFNDRDWNLRGWQFVTNPNYTYNATTGLGSHDEPQRLLLSQVSTAAGVIGGIITSGPLKGTAFGEGGNPYQFEYGYLVSGGQFQVGGPTWEQADIRGKWGNEPLASRMRGMGGLLNFSLDLTDNTTVSLMLSRNRSQTRNWSFSLEDYGSITLQSGNPFIPASVQAAMDEAGASTIALGTMHPDLDLAMATGDRTVSRAVLSLEGKLPFAQGWNWDAYYQYGESKQHYSTPGMWNTAHLAKAYDAVLDPVTNQIVCRVTLADPSDPCVPYNPMGIGVNSAAAIHYVEGNGTIQERMNYMSQNVAAASINGTPFSWWAGEVSLAAGAELRREWMGHSWVDDMSLAGQWWAGNSRPSEGSFTVREAFVETVVPLARDLPFAQSAELQAAVRVEDYSTTGTVTAWKTGLTWRPVDSLTVRGSLSHDVRAPSLIELFSSGTGSAPYILDPWQPDIPEPGYGISVLNVGNPDLRPEKADSWGAGLVFQPVFIHGLGVSVDYWDTKMVDAIGTALTQQEIVDNCFEGQTDFCSLVDWEDGPGSRINVVRRSQVNNANARFRGVDYEVSYRLAPQFMPGSLSLRLMATNFLENSSVNNGVETDVAGQNTGSVPDWRWTASAAWTNGTWNTNLVARGVSSGLWNNYFVECSSGCPVSTTRNVTVNDNTIAGAVYFDASVSRNINFGGGSTANVFLNVRNLFDKDPPVVGEYGSFADTLSAANPALYDVLGRIITAGVKVEF